MNTLKQLTQSIAIKLHNIRFTEYLITVRPLVSRRRLEGVFVTEQLSATERELTFPNSQSNQMIKSSS